MRTGLDNARGLYLDAIGGGDVERGIERYAGARYVQHSHPVPDGKEGFKAFFAAFVEREPDRRMDIVRGFQDRHLVFLHVVQVLGGRPTWVTMDIFDTDADGRLVEHWDVISAWQEPGSGPSMVDGPTDPGEEHPTEANKDLVRSFLEDVLMTGRTDRLPRYVAVDEYVEHSPRLLGGPAGLLTWSGGGRPHGRYHSTRVLLGRGQLVAALSHATVSGRDSAVIDLVRVTPAGIVEHWDTVEEIAPEEEWVNGGKF